jgi:hypothetical protein
VAIVAEGGGGWVCSAVGGRKSRRPFGCSLGRVRFREEPRDARHTR